MRILPNGLSLSGAAKTLGNKSEFRHQMRSGDLLACVSLNCLLNRVVSCSWYYFAQIQPISQKFISCVTDRRTNGRTDGRTDTPSDRDARTHLKIHFVSFIQVCELQFRRCKWFRSLRRFTSHRSSWSGGRRSLCGGIWLRFGPSSSRSAFPHSCHCHQTHRRSQVFARGKGTYFRAG